MQDNISDPITTIPKDDVSRRNRASRNISGRAGNVPVEDAQGFGIIGHHPPPFDPVAEFGEAFKFYEENGYVVVNQLDDNELAQLNAVCDQIHDERGAEIDVPGQGQLFFPLVNYPEFDGTVFHRNTLPLVGRILGSMEHVRHIEFNYRAWQPITSDYGMAYHPDDCSGGLLTLDQRQTRLPYGPPDMLSTFTYLTDVDHTTPCFAVVPKSRRAHNIQQLREALGDEYSEVPIHGKAGTCCIVDRSTIHTRLDPFEKDKSRQRSRRILHHVYARAGELHNADGTLRTGNGQPLVVTDWAFSRGLIPKRLAMADDPAVSRLFSVWPSHQRAWMATGFADDFVSDPKSARGPTVVGVYRNDGKNET